MGQPINILIVDDEPKNLTVLETILDDPGYRLVRAESADKALLALIAEEFAVLILDIRMPGMTGFELAQTIKARKKTARVPIIFLTAFYNEDQHVLTGYNSGAVDYLHKPVSAPILRSKVAVFAELHRTQRECGLANTTLLAEMTERRRAEEQLRVLNETLEQRVAERTEALRESEEWVRRIFKQSPAGIVQTDAHGNMVSVNDRWCEMLGFSRSELLERSVADVTDASSLEVTLENVRRLAESGPDFQIEMNCRRKDGTILQVQSNVAGLRDAAGRYQGLLAVVLDLTERHRAEAALRETEQHYQALAEASLDIPYRMSADWSAMLPLDGRGVVASSDGPLTNWAWLKQNVPRDEHARVRQAISEAIAQKHLFELEHRVLRPDGSTGWVRSRAVPILDDNGGLVAWFGAASDITERKRIEKTLVETTAFAEKANRAKSDFLSGMSHELRTPLNAILGFAQLMESAVPAPTPTQMQDLQQIIKGGWYLLDLINELLDLAKIESGKLPLTLEPVSLADVMLECQAMMEPLACERGIGMTFPSFELPGDVHADRTRVKQVVVNLLSNAVKYNKAQGAVTVEWALSPPDAIRVSVRDTGEGLAPEKLAQLFQPFNRLGKEAGPEEGTGLGLALSSRLVELMGGTIGADSAVGVGSVFWFELKCTPAAQAVR